MWLKTRSILKSFACSNYFQKFVPRYSEVRQFSVKEAFNARPRRSFELKLLGSNKGLFGYPDLITSEGFYKLKHDAEVAVDLLTKEALLPRKNRTRNVVDIFDELSDTLCKVADLAEFIRLSHPDNLFASAAEEACCFVSVLVEKLNTNQELYFALKGALEDGDVNPMDEIDSYVCRLFLLDFEQNGIHLPLKARLKVLQANEYILHLGQKFMNGSMQPRRISKDKLPHELNKIFDFDGSSVLVTGLYADSPNEMAREAAYKIYLHPDETQDFYLTKLLEERNVLAQLCGYNTYADRAVLGSLAGDPKFVSEFLGELSDAIQPIVENDFDILRSFKKKHSYNSGGLQMWDVSYYTGIAKQQLLDIKRHLFAPYFSLGSCMDGLSHLLHSLYGVTFNVEPCEIGESWNYDVIKLGVSQGSHFLGYIYCDFYERPGKPNQDCHFTIRGGRQLPDGTYQIPVVVVLLNLHTPTGNQPTLLSPSSVDNLFHEMGHALHSLLARTKYQHVTGTRCATDLAEVPSTLMEHFSCDPRVLRDMAVHYKTGEKMKNEDLLKWCASKSLFSASDMQLQIFYAMVDQKFHAQFPLGKSTTDLLKDIQTKYYSIPYCDNTAWQLRFSHLVGYGAKYYSYLVSRAVAASIWNKFFHENPFDSQSGHHYLENFLRHGGSVPPRKLVEELLGIDVSPGSLVKSLTTELERMQYITKSLCRFK